MLFDRSSNDKFACFDLPRSVENVFADWSGNFHAIRFVSASDGLNLSAGRIFKVLLAFQQSCESFRIFKH